MGCKVCGEEIQIRSFWRFGTPAKDVESIYHQGAGNEVLCIDCAIWFKGIVNDDYHNLLKGRPFCIRIN